MMDQLSVKDLVHLGGEIHRSNLSPASKLALLTILGQAKVLATRPVTTQKSSTPRPPRPKKVKTPSTSTPTRGWAVVRSGLDRPRVVQVEDPFNIDKVYHTREEARGAARLCRRGTR
jgi:hypothetical protein